MKCEIRFYLNSHIPVVVKIQFTEYNLAQTILWYLQAGSDISIFDSKLPGLTVLVDLTSHKSTCPVKLYSYLRCYASSINMLTSLSNLTMIQKTPIPYTTKMVELQNMGPNEMTQMSIGTYKYCCYNWSNKHE